MVKLTAIGLLKSNGPDKQATLLGIEADLSTFGFFQRGTVREMLTFVSRTAAQRTLPGQRQTVRDPQLPACFCARSRCRAAPGAAARSLQALARLSLGLRPCKHPQTVLCGWTVAPHGASPGSRLTSVLHKRTVRHCHAA